MSEKEKFSCKICNKIQKEPIFLPCLCFSICKKHLDDLKIVDIDQTIECKECHELFNISQNSFKSNKLIKELIESKSYLTSEENYQKMCLEKNLTHVSNDLTNFKKAYNKFEVDIFDFFAKARRDIDLRREQLINELHNESDALINQVKQAEDSYKLIVKETIRCNRVEFNFDDYLYAVSEKFRDLSLNMKQIKELGYTLENQIEEIKKEASNLESYRNDILLYRFKENKAFKFEKKLLGHWGTDDLEYQIDQLNQVIETAMNSRWKIPDFDRTSKDAEALFVKVLIENFQYNDLCSKMLENTAEIFNNSTMLKIIKENMRNIIFINKYEKFETLTEEEKRVIKDYQILPIFFKLNTRLFGEFNMKIGFFFPIKNPKIIYLQ